jgi:hypothetical protein
MNEGACAKRRYINRLMIVGEIYIAANCHHARNISFVVIPTCYDRSGIGCATNIGEFALTTPGLQTL